MKSLTARHIPIPAWARVFADERDGETGRLAAEAFASHMSAILIALHAKVETFLNDPEETQIGGFPEQERLTGEYYWGDRSY